MSAWKNNNKKKIKRNPQPPPPPTPQPHKKKKKKKKKKNSLTPIGPRIFYIDFNTLQTYQYLVLVGRTISMSLYNRASF